MPTLENFDAYIVGVSGGKDSTAIAIWAARNLPNNKIHLVHNPTGAAWPETNDYLLYLEKKLGIAIRRVRAGDMPLPLRRDGKPRDAWYSAPTLLEMVRGRGRWPSFQVRYCTKYLKQVPIRQYAHEFDNPILILGSRKEESKGRAALSQFDLDDSGYKDWAKYKTPVYYPILDWSESDVWASLRQARIEKNPVYEHVSRCSCWCCPLRSVNDIVKFALLHPSIAREAAAIEVEIGHTWRHKRSLKEIMETLGEESENQRKILTQKIRQW